MFKAVLGVLLVSAAPASAFVLSRSPLEGDWAFVRWPDSQLHVRYVLNDLPLEMLPNLSRSSEPLAAIQAAMQSWAIAPVQFSLSDTTTSITEANRDGTNVISFADTPQNRDITSGARVAATAVWFRSSGSQWNIEEVDTVFDPTERFATDGSTTAYDIQGVMTHELGHALGLSHSAIAAVTMYPYTEHGRLAPRALDPDDLAGMQALYHVAADPDTGSISGQVLTTDGDPVFGAHVVATNADGIVRIGALTDRDGSYTLPSLPAGSYQVYAEPLTGFTTPANYGAYYQEALTAFRPAFAGDLTAAPVTVTAGQTTALDPLKVDPEAPTLGSPEIGWSTTGTSFRVNSLFPPPLHGGDELYLVVIADNLDAVPDDGFHFSGSDLELDPDLVIRGTTAQNHPFAIIPLSVRAGATPGPRSLYLDSGAEQAVFTGAVVVEGQ